jgi:hypothetical protein
VSESQREPAAPALIAERYVPIILGVLAGLVNSAWIGFVLTNHLDWGNRFLDRVIQATSVGVAFWGIATTLFIGMESKPVVGMLRRLGYFGIAIRYFSETLIATSHYSSSRSCSNP